MDKTNLTTLYDKVVKLTGFQEDKKEKGWMPKLAPNDFRSVIKHGTYKGKKVVLKVSPHEDLVSIANNFRRYQKATAGGSVLQVPVILRSGKIKEAQFLIQISAQDGTRILPRYPLSTQEEKEEVANLYWNTVNSFPKFDFGEWAISDYFLERVDKWFTHGRENKAVKSGFITQQEKDKAVQVIFSNLQCLQVKPFFAHFANTDIVKTKEGYFIWDASIVPKPEAAGIALWLWGTTLYASHQLSADEWLKEIKKWIDVFTKFAPKSRIKELKLKIRINFLERLLGTLLVDLPLKRSPFQDFSDAEIKKATKVIRAVLAETL